MSGLEPNRLNRYLRHIDGAAPRKGVLDLFAHSAHIAAGPPTLSYPDSFNIGLYDGSVTPFTFEPFVTVPDTPYVIDRVIFGMELDGAPDSGGWGSTGGALTNGWQMFFRTSCGLGEDSFDFLNGTARIKKNGELAMLMFDLATFSWGLGSQFLAARWTFKKGGYGLCIDPRKGDYMKFQFNDDMTAHGLLNFTIVAHGFYLEDVPELD